jgi:TolB-like protein/Tfp pilus assembly protein PilF
LALILVVAGYMSWRHFRPGTPLRSEKLLLAVLPFQNLTGDPEREYLADGLTEETISQLSRLNPKQLGVIARTSVMGYKHSDQRLDRIGRDLSVQYVLESSLRGSKDHMRITAQLIEVKDQSHLWSQDYDYRAQDILSVQDDVAKAVARQIELRLSPQQEAGLTQARPVNPETFDAYLQGNYFLRRNDDMAARYFERATQLDPSYARAWIGLSEARFRQTDRGLIPTEEGHRLVREAVDRALALDPNLAVAHAEMGTIQQAYDFDWAGGDASFQRAIALEPGNPDILRSAAYSSAQFGRFDEGLRLARRAIELDPLNARRRVFLGQLEYWVGALDEAAADLMRARELSPDAPSHIFLAEIYVMQGRPQDALAEIERERTDPFRLQRYAIAYHALGREKESDAALRELIAKYDTIAAFQIAQVYAFRKQPNEAFEWLDRAYAQRDGGLVETKVNPLLKSLHGDPRYAALLKKLNLQ